MLNKKVFVGLSGGVDSAVSAALLKQKGYEVVGVFIRTWHPEFLECNEEEERRDAMRIAAHLDIPFLTFDLENVYKKEVGEYMINEYKAGRTPNPDVMCNKEVKFGAFLKKAMAMGADYVATGHYALNTASQEMLFIRSSDLRGPNPRPDHSKKHFLLRSPDESKDQSYFLWALDKKLLPKIVFPVGGFKKSEVRKLANKFKLPVAEKKDSQGICFLGPVDLKEFLKHYIKEKKGKVVNGEGEVIGRHNGVAFHTLGERHGFTITQKTPNDKPYYVVGKDIKKNELIVSQNPPRLAKEGAGGGEIKIKNTNWIIEPNKDKKYTAQIRYHGELLPCTVMKNEVIFEKPVLADAGQSIVIYDKDVCLGGGVIV